MRPPGNRSRRPPKQKAPRRPEGFCDVWIYACHINRAGRPEGRCGDDGAHARTCADYNAPTVTRQADPLTCLWGWLGQVERCSEVIEPARRQTWWRSCVFGVCSVSTQCQRWHKDGLTDRHCQFNVSIENQGVTEDLNGTERVLRLEGRVAITILALSLYFSCSNLNGAIILSTQPTLLIDGPLTVTQFPPLVFTVKAPAEAHVSVASDCPNRLAEWLTSHTARAEALSIAWGVVLGRYALETTVAFAFRYGDEAPQRVQIDLRARTAIRDCVNLQRDGDGPSTSGPSSALSEGSLVWVHDASSDGDGSTHQGFSPLIELTIDPRPVLRLKADAARMDESAARRILDQVIHVLDALVDTPQRPLSELSILPPAEECFIVHTWNDTDCDFGDPRSLWQLFSVQARERPNEPALISEGGVLTFSQLEDTVLALAARLAEHGVTTGAPVGIHLPRSLDSIISVLAILRLQAVFVPLDPAYPLERLRYMIRDSGCGIAMTLPESAAQIAQDVATLLYPATCDSASSDRLSPLTLNTSSVPLSEANRALPPTLSPAADAPLYLLYTSGSTGTPKGVLGTHGATLNRLRWMWEVYPFAPDEVAVQSTTLNFVDAIWEIFGALLKGLPTAVMSDSALHNIRDFIECVEGKAVTRLVLVPSLLRALLAAPAALRNRLRHLRFCTSSGESLEPDLARLFFSRLPSTRLLNLYGSSEVAGDVTAYEVTPANADEGVMFIGRPVANTHIFILDQARRLQPIGAPGEVFVTGAHLARGYHRLPEATADRFVDLVLPGFCGRAFRTGDLARLWPDGRLEYLGRRDDQVKIRGHRIEIEEVQRALASHPDVATCSILTAADENRDQQLLAFFESAAELEGSTLRDYLARRLPNYMVPTHFHRVTRIPLTPNGKIDRRTLLREAAQNRSAVMSDPPATPIEIRILQIWRECLGNDIPGVTHNLFDLGAQSVSIMRLMVRLESEFNVSLTSDQLLALPTIRAQAGWFDGDRAASTTRSERGLLKVLQPNGSLKPLFLVHGYGGGIFGYADLARSLGTDRPVIGIQARGFEDGLEPDRDMQAIVSRYIAAIVDHQPEGPYFLGGYCSGGIVAFEMARQLRAQGQEVAYLAIIEGYATSRGEAVQSLASASGLYRFACNVGPWLSDELNRRLGPIGLGGRVRRIAQSVQREWHALDAEETPEEIVPDIEVIGPQYRVIMEAHDAAMTGYRPGPYDRRISVFRVATLSLFRAGEEDLGWGRVSKSVDVYPVAGAHFDLLHRPHVMTLVAMMRESLSRAEA